MYIHVCYLSGQEAFFINLVIDLRPVSYLEHCWWTEKFHIRSTSAYSMAALY